jgi:hypothetical protein
MKAALTLLVKAILTRKASAVLNRETHVCDTLMFATGLPFNCTFMQWCASDSPSPTRSGVRIVIGALQLLPLVISSFELSGVDCSDVFPGLTLVYLTLSVLVSDIVNSSRISPKVN